MVAGNVENLKSTHDRVHSLQIYCLRQPLEFQLHQRFHFGDFSAIVYRSAVVFR